MPENKAYFHVIPEKEMTLSKEVNSDTIEEQIKAFLKSGGKVDEITRGKSGVPIEPKRNRKETLIEAKKFKLYKNRGRR